jgi:hypothetical protein
VYYSSVLSWQALSVMPEPSAYVLDVLIRDAMTLARKRSETTGDL